MNIRTLDISCGIRQAVGLYGHNKQNAVSIGDGIYSRESTTVGAGMVIFSDVATRSSVSSGADFANYLRNLHFGAVEETSVVRNPNSGNKIKMWIFIPNHRKFRAWWKANR